EKVSDLDHNLLSLEVELDDDLAAMFRLRLVTEDGILTYLDDERFLIWNQVTIYAGFESGMEELIAGYITHVKPDFGVEPSESTLEIWGMDGSVLMDREEKLKDWHYKKDSDIAAEIFDLYGFTPEVENTEVVHDEAISTIIQRETDIQFLRRLALRNGFECYVEGEAGYFRSMPVDATPQPILVLHDEDHRNVNRFSVEVNALTPANVTMFQVDRFNKQVLKAAAESNQQAILGGKDAKSLLAAGMNPGQVYIGMSPATGNPEMTAICQKLFHESEWFVTGEG
ncbi:MAG: phage late control D family protein, partial [Gammaproteobacteria bacterium]|nr:phage late control D family protein [Gammaproteobacteria bacterium]